MRCPAREFNVPYCVCDGKNENYDDENVKHEEEYEILLENEMEKNENFPNDMRNFGITKQNKLFQVF